MTNFSRATSSCLASPGVGQTAHLLIAAILSLSAPRHFAKTEIFFPASDNSIYDSKNSVVMKSQKRLVIIYFQMLCFAEKLPEAEFKEFEMRLKFKLRLKIYSMFQDLNRRLI